MSDGLVTRQVLQAYVEQIEDVFGQIDGLNEDKKAIYGAAHDDGIEKTALGKVVGFRRQRSKNPAKFDEQDALVQKYLALLDGSADDQIEPHTRIRAREAEEQWRTRTEFFARLEQEREAGLRPQAVSFIYFLNAAEAGVIKIGVTNDLDRRIGSITRMSPLPLELLLSVPGNHRTEAEFHERFSASRLHGEWFSTTDGVILEFIRTYVPHDEDGVILETNSATDSKRPADTGNADEPSSVEPVGEGPAPLLATNSTSMGRAADATGGGNAPVATRTHNPQTHFLNSDGLLRLHGCEKPESCASSHPRTRLCFTCSTQHEGPAYLAGDEQRESVH